MAQILQMICGVCGQENSAVGTTCPACGASVSALPLREPDRATAPDDQTTVLGSLRHDEITHVGNGDSPARESAVQRPESPLRLLTSWAAGPHTVIRFRVGLNLGGEARPSHIAKSEAEGE